jgi:non-specific serine/threonine protein kinase
LRRLSVFAGGWDLEAAEAVYREKSRENSRENSEVLDLLASLLDRSLVGMEEEPPDGGVLLRYRMLETVKEYALERLKESGAQEEEAVRGGHAAHYLALAEQAHPFLETREPAWLDRLETEHDNLRTALTYFAGNAGQEEFEGNDEHIDKTVRLVAALAPFWSVRGHYYEKQTWLLSLAARPTPPTKARAELLRWAAGLFDDYKDFARAKQMLTERLQIVRQLGDQREIARALITLAGLISHPRQAGPEYDYVTACALAEESLAIAREMGDRQGMAHVLFLLGHLAREIGDKNEARARWLECHALDQERGNKGGYVLRALGDLACDSGDLAAARGFLGRYLTECYEVGDRWNVASVLTVFCSLALAEGEAQRAARLLGASLALCESFYPLSEDQRTHYGVLRDAVRAVLDDSALVAAEAAGSALTLEQAMELALWETSATSA